MLEGETPGVAAVRNVVAGGMSGSLRHDPEATTLAADVLADLARETGAVCARLGAYLGALDHGHALDPIVLALHSISVEALHLIGRLTPTG